MFTETRPNLRNLSPRRASTDPVNLLLFSAPSVFKPVKVSEQLSPFHMRRSRLASSGWNGNQSVLEGIMEHVQTKVKNTLKSLHSFDLVSLFLVAFHQLWRLDSSGTLVFVASCSVKLIAPPSSLLSEL